MIKTETNGGRTATLTGQSSYTMDDAPKLAHDLYYLGVHLQDTIIMQMIQEYLTASFIVYGDITKTMCLISSMH